MPRPLAAAWQREPTGTAIRVAIGAVVLVGVLNLVLPRSLPLGIILNGAVLGSLYGLIAIGVILVYRANRVINFAQAGLGAVPAVVALLLITDHGWPYAVAVPVLIGGALALGALVEVLLVRRFAQAPRLILAVVTIGIGQLLAYVEFWVPDWMTGDPIPPTEFPTPWRRYRFEVGGTIFSGDDVATIVVVAVVAAALGLFFRFTRMGMAVRASAENAERASLLGIPVRRVSTIVWMLAAVLSAVGMFLRAPLVGLPMGTIVGPSILIYALAAAVVARMERLPVALFAGMGLGAIDLSVYYATRDSVLSDAAMLPVILVALLVQRVRTARAEDTGIATWRNVKEFRPVPLELRGLREVRLARAVLGAVVAATALALPFAVGRVYRNDASLLVIYAIVGVSLVILTGWAGQISLGQFAFVGLGAAVAGGLAADHGWDFFLTIAVAGMVGAAMAVLIGLPAVRMPGLFLAVTTLAFAAAMRAFGLNRRYFDWVLPEESNPVYRPKLYGKFDTGDDLLFYYVCLAFLVLFVVVARQVRASRSGRVMIAVRSNARAAEAYGVNLARTRLAAFAISGFMAATAGALFAYQQGAVDTTAYPAVNSIKVFAMTVVGGLTSIAGGVAGAVYLITFERFPWFERVQLIELLATGVGLMILLLFFPGGLAELGYRARDHFLRWVAARHAIHVPSLVADSLEERGEPATRAEPPDVVVAAQRRMARSRRRARAVAAAVAVAVADEAEGELVVEEVRR